MKNIGLQYANQRYYGIAFFAFLFHHPVDSKSNIFFCLQYSFSVILKETF